MMVTETVRKLAQEICKKLNSKVLTCLFFLLPDAACSSACSTQQSMQQSTDLLVVLDMLLYDQQVTQQQWNCGPNSSAHFMVCRHPKL
jgi:hypothetical protein